MKVLEVKNNLVKIEYSPEDNLLLSGFVVIEDSQSPYVAQILSLKADRGINYAIVKLLFTFNGEGILKSYDGTIPSFEADVSKINSDELLDILPISKPLKIGEIAHQGIKLKVDMSILEKNLLVCSDNNEDSNVLVENFVYQLNNENHKVLVIDTDGSYSGQKLDFGTDFKLPLNYETLNFIYDHDLKDIEPTSKAVIQDIFLEMQEYSKTVLDKFIPFNTFMQVVDAQYRELGIPELLLLKNKLLKYKEADVFAQTPDEIQNLRSLIRANSTNILNISGVDDVLQNEIIKYVYDTVDALDLFVYAFVPLNNDNADKKLIRQMLGKDKIYTTIVCSHNFKYIYELKERANNMILFAPQTMQHDFSAYNTFLNKLNSDEFIIYGKATQNIPLIVKLVSMLDVPEEEETVEEEVATEPDTEEEQQVEEEPTEDEFSDESNSYSYETLMEDTAITPEPEPVEEVEESEPEQVEEPAEEVEEEAEPVENEESSEDVESSEEVEDKFGETVEAEEPQTDDFETAHPEEFFNTEEISSFIDKEIEEESLVAPENSEEEEANDNVIDADFSEINEPENLEPVEDEPVEEETHVMQPSEEALAELPEIKEEDLLPPLDDEVQDTVVPTVEPDLSEKISSDVDELIYSSEKEEVPMIDEVVEEEQNAPTEAGLLPEQEDDNLTEDDLNFIQDVNTPVEDSALPVYPAEENMENASATTFEAGDHVSHPKYGEGIVEKIIKYGSKSLCSISFVNIGRRLLDPAISEITKL